MPIQSSRYYNDPALGAAFSNLAAAFGPPSGSDLAGYATAKAKREEAIRLAEQFNYAKQAGFDKDTFDRMLAATGTQNISQGYYGVDTAATTARRGQDIESADRRYGYDQSLAGTKYTADQSLVGTRYATDVDAKTEMAKKLLDPLNANQTRPAVGVDVLGALGFGNLPALPEQRGIVTLNQGETATLPGGGTIAGAPKPQTEAEVKGGIIAGLPAADQRSVALQGVPVEQVIVGGKPTFVTRDQAVGQTPYNKPTADSATELTKLITERDALPPGDPRRQAYDARIAALGRGQQQSAYDRGLDEDLNKLNTSIFEGAKSAYAERGLYNTVLAAVDNPSVDQGTMASATLGLRKTLTAFGIPAGNTGPAEMLNALGGQIALKLRNADGANMPGAMSDADREFLKSMSVSLGNSPEANRLLAQYYLGIQQRAIDLNDLRDGYVQKNGRLDEGFRTEMANYLRTADPTAKLRDQIAGQTGATPGPAAPAPANNPPATAVAAPPVGTIEDGHRFLGGNPADPNAWEVVQ